jgi:outer membrane protein
MKNLSKAILQVALFGLIFACPFKADAANAKADQSIKVRVINFKTCVENSKAGKIEQSNFEGLKKQMETMLSEKEKTLNDMADKFNDPDYLDSLSPEAETELKRKFRALSQEASQQQAQYYQALQQSNAKILDKLDEYIIKASDLVSKKDGINLIVNEDSVYFYDKDLDISNDIIVIMDELFEKEPKSSTEASAVTK